MTKRLLSVFIILSCLRVDAQIHQNTPYEQKKKIEYDTQTDSLLRSAFSLLNAYKIQLKDFNQKNAQNIEIEIQSGNLWEKIDSFDYWYNQERKKHALIVNSKDAALKDVKIASTLFKRTAILHAQILAVKADFQILNQNAKAASKTLAIQSSKTQFSKPLLKYSVPKQYATRVEPKKIDRKTSSDINEYSVRSKGSLKEYRYVPTISKENKMALTNYQTALATARPLEELSSFGTQKFSNQTLNNPTSYVHITNEFTNMTLFDVSHTIKASLEERGYHDHYNIFIDNQKEEDGFLVVTKMEQIDDKNYSLNDPERWSSNINISGIWENLKSVIITPVGHFRLFVFEVKKLTSLNSKTPKGYIEVNPKGLVFVKADYRQDFPSGFKNYLVKDYICKVLVYEFFKKNDNSNTILLDVSMLDSSIPDPDVIKTHATKHLNTSNILPTIKRHVSIYKKRP